MLKFKVGDKVRITSVFWGVNDKVGTVTAIGSKNREGIPYCVEVQGKPIWCTPEEVHSYVVNSADIVTAIDEIIASLEELKRSLS